MLRVSLLVILALASGPALAQSCEQEVSAELAATYVDQCLEVSPATHPPCNAENSCELIQNEIPAEAKAARRDLTEAIHLTEATKEQIRMLAQGLRPPALDALGLNLTLESFCRDFSKRTQLQIRYRGSDVAGLPDVANMCVYRTLQEALANVVRHAGATRVDVRLLHDVDCVRLIVEDNGTGPGAARKRSSAKASGGIGLLGMQERLDLFGGGLKIEKAQTGGLRLSAFLPLREKA
jgi:signal transduction histidine kinase